MMDEKLVHYMKIIDHLVTAKEYLNKTDAWIGAEIHVIIENVRKRAGDQAYESARKEWNSADRIGG